MKDLEAHHAHRQGFIETYVPFEHHAHQVSSEWKNVPVFEKPNDSILHTRRTEEALDAEGRRHIHLQIRFFNVFTNKMEEAYFTSPAIYPDSKEYEDKGNLG